MDQYRYPTVSSFFEYIRDKQVSYLTWGLVHMCIIPFDYLELPHDTYFLHTV